MNQPGTYTFNTTGVVVGQYTYLRSGPTTIIAPPASSAGFTCIKVGNHPITPDQRSAVLYGLRLRKGTGEQDWTGIEIVSDSFAHGNSFTSIEDCLMYLPGTGIKFMCTGDGWTSNANIVRTSILFSQIGVDFVKGGTRDTPFRCVFDDLTVQSGTVASGLYNRYGFKNIQYSDLTFRDCKVWDLEDSALQKTMTIAPIAENIRIKGGIMSRQDGVSGFSEDNSTARSVYVEPDEWQLPTYGHEALTSSIFVQDGRRKGGWEPSSGTGWGMTAGAWTNHATGGAGTPLTIAYADGTQGTTYTTGATSGNGAGIRYPTLITCRGWNPIYKVRFRLGATSGTSRRAAFGWIGSTSFDISADNILNVLNGVVLAIRAAETTYRILHNDGTGVGGAIDTGVTINASEIVTFELYAMESRSTSRWRYSINGTWFDLVSGDVPAQTTGLAPYAQIATSTTAPKSMDLFGVYVETK